MKYYLIIMLALLVSPVTKADTFGDASYAAKLAVADCMGSHIAAYNRGVISSTAAMNHLEFWLSYYETSYEAMIVEHGADILGWKEAAMREPMSDLMTQLSNCRSYVSQARRGEFRM